LHAILRSKRACVASAVSMYRGTRGRWRSPLRRGRPDRGRAGCPSRASCGGARHGARQQAWDYSACGPSSFMGPPLGQALAEGSEQGLVLLLGPTLTRRQRESRGYEVTSRTRMPRRYRFSKTTLGSCRAISMRKKLAREGYTRQPRQIGELREERVAQSHQPATLASSMSRSLSAASAATCVKKLTLYGRRALFTSRTSAGAASR